MKDHDFAAAWHTLTANDPNHRGESAVDLAFWESHARGYDENASAPGRSAATLAAIKSLVRPDDTLLDVGAGTGRFALPLANSVKEVTALDHAAPMLEILMQKMVDQNISNI
ncbi:MAG: methyltransferase domain-containing protein, partial [Chloroflexota bacterium]